MCSDVSSFLKTVLNTDNNFVKKKCRKKATKYKNG